MLEGPVIGGVPEGIPFFWKTKESIDAKVFLHI